MRQVRVKQTPRTSQAAPTGPFGFRDITSPVGPLRLIATPRGLAEIVYLAQPETDTTAGTLHRCDAELVGPVQPEDAYAGHDGLRIRDVLAQTETELGTYFAGQLKRFSVPLDPVLSSGFYLEARRAMCQIPYGHVASYGEVAAMAGRPRAARAVGTACAHNPIPIIVPCHRVVPASGGMGSYGGGEWVKALLLTLEGVALDQLS